MSSVKQQLNDLKNDHANLLIEYNNLYDSNKELLSNQAMDPDLVQEHEILLNRSQPLNLPDNSIQESIKMEMEKEMLKKIEEERVMYEDEINGMKDQLIKLKNDNQNLLDEFNKMYDHNQSLELSNKKNIDRITEIEDKSEHTYSEQSENNAKVIEIM